MPLITASPAAIWQAPVSRPRPAGRVEWLAGTIAAVKPAETNFASQGPLRSQEVLSYAGLTNHWLIDAM